MAKKHTLITAKNKGETLAEFTFADGMARLRMDHAGKGVADAHSRARYIFQDPANERTVCESPDVAVKIEKVDNKWSTTVVVGYWRNGEKLRFHWFTGLFSGTRGMAAYRAILRFDGDMGDGTVSKALKTEDGTREGSVRKVREGSARTGPTLPDREAMKRAVRDYYAAGHPVPSEVASLPDPRLNSGQLAGATRIVCTYQAGEPREGSFVPETEEDPTVGTGICPNCRGKVDVRGGRVVRHLRGGNREAPTPKCTAARVRPLKGTARDGITGICPNCRGRVELTAKGNIPTHLRGGVGAPTSKALKERIVPAVDTAGSPARDAEKRMAEHIARVGGDAAEFAGTRDAATRGQRGHGSTDGSAFVGAHDLPPVRPERGYLGAAGTFALSMTVRPGIDSRVKGKNCPVCNELPEVAHRGKGAAWRRRHSKKVAAWHEEHRTALERRNAQEVSRGRRLPRGERRKLRKAASIGSYAAGVQAASGVVVHATVAAGE